MYPEYESQEKIWTSLSYSVSTIFFVANVCHWVAAISTCQESVEPRSLSWGPNRRVYKNPGQVSAVPVFEQSGGMNAEHLKECSWKDSKAWGGMKWYWSSPLSIKCAFTLLQLTYSGSCNKVKLSVSEKSLDYIKSALPGLWLFGGC